MSDNVEVVSQDKAPAAAGAEYTRPTPVTVPLVDIYETDTELVVLADMPGVRPDDLSIRLEDDTLTLEGEAAPSASAQGEALLTEYAAGRYRRQFTLGESIDRAKIEARLKNGELRLVLPKAEKAKPQRIEVQAG